MIMPSPFLRALAAIAAVAPMLSSQAPNLLPTNMTQWTVQANSARVTSSATRGYVNFRDRATASGAWSVSASVGFRATVAGSYSLWLDAAFASGPGSAEKVTWSISGIGSGIWTQNDANARDVAQWVIDLPANQPFTLTISSKIYSPGGIGWIFPGSLRQVDKPVFVPGRVANYQGYAVADFSIARSGAYTQATYLLYLSPSRLTKPIQLPFGDLWLANVQYLGALLSASWRPQNRLQEGAAYAAIASRSGMHWQVLEFDRRNPLTTLKLGSPILTQRRR